jgi:hypothetical protein
MDGQARPRSAHTVEEEPEEIHIIIMRVVRCHLDGNAQKFKKAEIHPAKANDWAFVVRVCENAAAKFRQTRRLVDRDRYSMVIAALCMRIRLQRLITQYI